LSTGFTFHKGAVTYSGRSTSVCCVDSLARSFYGDDNRDRQSLHEKATRVCIMTTWWSSGRILDSSELATQKLKRLQAQRQHLASTANPSSRRAFKCIIGGACLLIVITSVLSIYLFNTSNAPSSTVSPIREGQYKRGDLVGPVLHNLRIALARLGHSARDSISTWWS